MYVQYTVTYWSSSQLKKLFFGTPFGDVDNKEGLINILGVGGNQVRVSRRSGLSCGSVHNGLWFLPDLDHRAERAPLPRAVEPRGGEGATPIQVEAGQHWITPFLTHPPARCPSPPWPWWGCHDRGVQPGPPLPWWTPQPQPYIPRGLPTLQP